MSKIINPRLFSQQFGVPKADIDKAGFLDPLLNADTKLFIDPLLLRKSGNATLRTKGVAAFRKRTADIVSLLMASPTNSGPAWTAALRLLDLHERRETCLGYGGAGTSGSSRPDGLKTRILNTTRDIVKLGVTNPEIIGLMGIFEDDVGPDTISDMTTNSLLGVLQEITLGFCSKYSIPTGKFIWGWRSMSCPLTPS
ncbi:hypothetical protein [Bradyrhizobium sp. SHOUNA76]|uniref:hypothetical protein n=1 Tax=Bradyrhizobium sp. SHOUNA76 TaxID=2908927 RepID=UPI001FF49984|nr:hypothetical protein [Bradyrhizobium sp. SHOUNA76]MCJ9700179.1 hypothetical protein [Bradyrhizobium sp. SHOUNA76]